MVGIAYLKMRRPELAGPIFGRIARDESVPTRSATGPRRWPSSTHRRVRGDKEEAGQAAMAPFGRNKGKCRMKRLVLALAAAGLLGGCSLLGGRERPGTPTVGQREPVLGTESQVEIDPLLADVAVTVPGPIANSEWAQPGGNAAKSMVHVALGGAADPGVERQHRLRQQHPHPARLRAGRRRRPGLHDRHAARVRAFNADTGALSGSGRCAARPPERVPVRRRRQL